MGNRQSLTCCLLPGSAISLIFGVNTYRIYFLMKQTLFVLAMLGLWLGVMVPAQAGSGATAEIVNAEGKVIGSATFLQEAQGVLVSTRVEGLEPGKHPMHLHAVGKCEGPTFKSAGPHFDGAMGSGMAAMASMKGKKTIGDLPALIVGRDGSGKEEILNPHLSLASGKSNSLIGGQGTALLIHDARMPSKRIACGILRPTVVSPTSQEKSGR